MISLTPAFSVISWRLDAAFFTVKRHFCNKHISVWKQATNLISRERCVRIFQQTAGKGVTWAPGAGNTDARSDSAAAVNIPRHMKWNTEESTLKARLKAKLLVELRWGRARHIKHTSTYSVVVFFLHTGLTQTAGRHLNSHQEKNCKKKGLNPLISAADLMTIPGGHPPVGGEVEATVWHFKQQGCEVTDERVNTQRSRRLTRWKRGKFVVTRVLDFPEQWRSLETQEMFPCRRRVRWIICDSELATITWSRFDPRCTRRRAAAEPKSDLIG